MLLVQLLIQLQHLYLQQLDNTVTTVTGLDTNTAAATAAIASDEVAADTGNDTDRTSWL